MAILILSVAPTNSISKVNLSSTSILSIRSDYLLHVILFVPWMILAKWRWGDRGSKNAFWYALGVGLVLAAFSEAVQMFLPDRTFNLFDLAANSLGIFVGAMVAGWGWRKAL